MDNVTRFKTRRHIGLEPRAGRGNTGPLEEGEGKGEEIDESGHDKNDNEQKAGCVDSIDIEQGCVDMEQGKCVLLISADKLTTTYGKGLTDFASTTDHCKGLPRPSSRWCGKSELECH